MFFVCLTVRSVTIYFDRQLSIFFQCLKINFKLIELNEFILFQKYLYIYFFFSLFLFVHYGKKL